MRRIAYYSVVCAVFGALAFGAAGQNTRASSVTAGQPLAAPWQRYIVAGKWSTGADYYRRAIVAECAGAGPDIRRLAYLHYSYSICKYFPHMTRRLYTDDAAERLKTWLLANPDANRTLLLSLTPSDDPGRVFEVLYQLLGHSPELVAQNQSLAIAFALVWDGYPRDKSLLLDSFGYFTDHADQMEFDLRSLPLEVLKYVVDTQRPLSERLWALKQYKGTSDIGRLYNKIWLYYYDRSAYSRGTQKKVSRYGGTLQNIREYGGVCHEAAVFASEVGKATGVPCAYVSGLSEGGIGHAWVGFLRKGSRGYRWDRDSGRLSDEEAGAGSVREPQSGASLPEHELDFALAALRLPEERRRVARTWCDVAALLAREGRKDLARAAMRASLKACIYHKCQWRTFALLARGSVFTPGQVAAAMAGFVEALEDYPNLAADAFEQLAPLLDKGDPEGRLLLYDQMTETFHRHNDVVGRMQLLKGRYLEELGRVEEAAQTCADAALELLKCKSAAVSLLDNAARLSIERGSVADAVALHERTLYRARRPGRSAYAQYTTWFAVGLRLAKLHALAGDRKAHDDTLDRICRYQRGTEEDRQALRARLTTVTYGQLNTSRKPAAWE